MRIPVTLIDDDSAPLRTPSNFEFPVQTDGEATVTYTAVYRCRDLLRLERAEFR